MQTIEITCPFCGKTEKMTIYEGVDAAKEPHLREKVLDSSIFTYTCPHCKGMTGVLYPFAYYDYQNRFIVRLAEGEEDPWNDDDPQVKASMQALKDNFKFRTVRDPNALLEKIILFESGKDDRAVELMKSVLSFRLWHESQIQVLGLYFKPDDDGDGFVIETEEGFVGEIAYDEDLYQNSLASVQRSENHALLNEYEINANWGRRFFEAQSLEDTEADLRS